MSNLSHYCNICEEHVCEFSPYSELKRPNAHCLKCNSLERHRLFKHWFDSFKTNLSANSKILHFAPEKCFSKIFTAISAEGYLSVDIKPGIAMKVEDITKLSFSDNNFDFIFCSHVLHHIPDDEAAMSELYRVLTIGGTLVLINSVTTYKTREVKFSYFKKMYNIEELKNRLITKGFDVQILTRKDLIPDDSDAFKMGIDDVEKLFICTKRRG